MLDAKTLSGQVEKKELRELKFCFFLLQLLWYHFSSQVYYLKGEICVVTGRGDLNCPGLSSEDHS